MALESAYDRVTPPLLSQRRRHVMSGEQPERVAFPKRQDTELRSANPGRVLQHDFEHRLQLAGRTGDDLQHLAGRGLLLQRFGEIVGALAQFVEQTCVLDGDHRLRGEILHQLDLLVGEGTHLLAVDNESADQLVVLEHRHAQCRSRSTQFGRRARSGTRRIILDMGDGVGPGDLLKNAPRLRPKRSAAPQELVELARCVQLGHRMEQIAIEAEHGGKLRLAEAGGIFQQSMKHRLQIAGRAGDDLEHFGGRGLLLQRFRKFSSELPDRLVRIGSRMALPAGSRCPKPFFCDGLAAPWACFSCPTAPPHYCPQRRHKPNAGHCSMALSRLKRVNRRSAHAWRHLSRMSAAGQAAMSAQRHSRRRETLFAPLLDFECGPDECVPQLVRNERRHLDGDRPWLRLVSDYCVEGHLYSGRQSPR